MVVAVPGRRRTYFGLPGSPGAGRGGLLVKKLVAFACIFLCLAVPLRTRAVSARAWAMVEQSSGRYIEGANVSRRLPMASTTKIMTALLAVESGRLDETITVPAEALTVEGTSMGLKAEERITLRSVVYGLMLRSGNDAANTVAMVLDGSLESFAAHMNRRAAQIGLQDTHFANPSGLDAAGHYTTALDLARLGAYAMRNADFRQIVGTKRIQVSYDGVPNGRTLTNHNRLLGTLDGVVGIKTGYTDKALRCLVTCAVRNGVTLVLATLNDPDDWDDHTALLAQGFSLLQPREMAVGLPAAEAVVGGTQSRVALTADPTLTAALRADESAKVEIDLPRFVYAPVCKGQQLGEAVCRANGVSAAREPIYAAADVPLSQRPAGLWARFMHFWQSLFSRR